MLAVLFSSPAPRSPRLWASASPQAPSAAAPPARRPSRSRVLAVLAVVSLLSLAAYATDQWLIDAGLGDGRLQRVAAETSSVRGHRRPIVAVEAFTLPAASIAHLSSNSSERVTLVADAFLADGCVKLVSVVTCQQPALNFSWLDIEVTGVWGAGEACGGVEGGGCAGAPRPASRVLHRDARNWEPVTISELCLPEFAAASRVDVRVWIDGRSHAYSLPRIPRGPASEVAMAVMYRGDVWTAPAWLDIWAALGIGHFYIYYNGELSAMRDEAPGVIAALERDARVTLHAWPYAMRTVIQDPTGTSTLPVVNKYGKILCYLHFAKMMAFNAAFHRYGSRHSHMGYFDFDEYLGLPQSVYDAAAVMDTSPLSALLAAHSAPDVLVVANRWVALHPPPAPRVPLSSASLLERRILLSDLVTDWKARSKFFVRSANVADAARAPYILGNHYVCRLAQRDGIRGGATVQLSGPCEQLDPAGPQLLRLPPPEYYNAHAINLKPHESLLTEIDEPVVIAGIVANGTLMPRIREQLLRWRAQRRRR